MGDYHSLRDATYAARPTTSVGESRLWRMASFEEMMKHKQKVQPVDPKPVEEVHETFRTENPDLYKFCTWGDPNDHRPRPKTAPKLDSKVKPKAGAAAKPGNPIKKTTASTPAAKPAAKPTAAVKK